MLLQVRFLVFFLLGALFKFLLIVLSYSVLLLIRYVITTSLQRCIVARLFHLLLFFLHHRDELSFDWSVLLEGSGWLPLA